MLRLYAKFFCELGGFFPQPFAQKPDFTAGQRLRGFNQIASNRLHQPLPRRNLRRHAPAPAREVPDSHEVHVRQAAIDEVKRRFRRRDSLHSRALAIRALFRNLCFCHFHLVITSNDLFTVSAAITMTIVSPSIDSVANRYFHCHASLLNSGGLSNLHARSRP
jgi:hypothetical protein